MADYRVARFHVPGDPTVSFVFEVIGHIETIYRSFLWRPGATVRSGHGLPDLSRSLVSRDAPNDLRMLLSSFGRDQVANFDAFFTLRNLRQTSPTELRLKALAPAGSFTFDVSGVGDAIDSLGEFIDPLRRRSRREQARHDWVMNLKSEKLAELEVQKQSISVLREQMQLLDEFVDRGVLTRTEASEAIRRLMDVQDSEAAELEATDVFVIEVVDDVDRSDDE